jgi:hypothetical protein
MLLLMHQLAPASLSCGALPEQFLPFGAEHFFLTPRHDIGISRDHGVISFDGAGIVLEPVKKAGCTTYLNGALVDEATMKITLAHGDTLGFGGAGARPSAETITVRADLTALGIPARMAPPPPQPPRVRATEANGGDDAGGEEAARAVSAEVGSRSRRGQTRTKVTPQGPRTPPPTEPLHPPLPRRTRYGKSARR